jgi:hypothetical protein
VQEVASRQAEPFLNDGWSGTDIELNNVPHPVRRRFSMKTNEKEDAPALQHVLLMLYVTLRDPQLRLDDTLQHSLEPKLNTRSSIIKALAKTQKLANAHDSRLKLTTRALITWDEDVYIAESDDRLGVGKMTVRRVGRALDFDMSRAHTLTNFLVQTQRSVTLDANATTVLAFVGHGNGWAAQDVQLNPEFPSALWRNVTVAGGPGDETTLAFGFDAPGNVHPLMFRPPPTLPQGEHTNAGHMIPTVELHRGLLAAQAILKRKLDVVYFQTCFGFSLEILSAVAPSASWIAGYPSYNFFTNGAAYPATISRLIEKLQSSERMLSPEIICRVLLEAHQAELDKRARVPPDRDPSTLGVLSSYISDLQVNRLCNELDVLADALITGIETARDLWLPVIQHVLTHVARYDTNWDGDFGPGSNDFLIDLRSFTSLLADKLGENDPLRTSLAGEVARSIRDQCAQLKHNGTVGPKVVPTIPADEPRFANDESWDYRGNLAIGIFLPQPTASDQGLHVEQVAGEVDVLWPWRALLMFRARSQEMRMVSEPIPFHANNHWLDFCHALHKAQNSPAGGLTRDIVRVVKPKGVSHLVGWPDRIVAPLARAPGLRIRARKK